jgi:hypothetical protein
MNKSEPSLPEGTDAARIQDGVQQVAPLSVEKLYRSADLSALSLASTVEIQSIDGLVGQERTMAIGL